MAARSGKNGQCTCPALQQAAHSTGGKVIEAVSLTLAGVAKPSYISRQCNVMDETCSKYLPAHPLVCLPLNPHPASSPLQFNKHGSCSSTSQAPPCNRSKQWGSAPEAEKIPKARRLQLSPVLATVRMHRTAGVAMQWAQPAMQNGAKQCSSVKSRAFIQQPPTLKPRWQRQCALLSGSCTNFMQ